MAREAQDRDPHRLAVPVAEVPGEQDLAFLLAKQLAEGQKLSEAIAAIGLDPGVASRLIRRPDFQEMVKAALPTVEDLRAGLMAVGGKAKATVTALMDCPKPEVQLRAATEVLDRIGLTPIRKTVSTSLVLEEERARLILDVLAEVGLPH